jgi:hypothetical protein
LNYGLSSEIPLARILLRTTGAAATNGAWTALHLASITHVNQYRTGLIEMRQSETQMQLICGSYACSMVPLAGRRLFQFNLADAPPEKSKNGARTLLLR